LTKHWARIDVTCGDQTADILAVEFAEAFGAGVEYIPGGIRFYLDSARFAAEKERVRLIATSAAPDEGKIGLAVSEIPDEDWSRTWKQHFKPLRVGKRFLVSPTWEDIPSEPERLIIRIDPGRAFGTGHHETTRLCLEWLESCSGPDGMSLLDIGTGSGILAIGAAMLGFRKIVGIDNDPEAIAVAKENVMLNGLSERISLFCAAPEGQRGSFGVVISNIESKPLIRMSEAISSKVRNNGLLALSGILSEQAGEVCAEYERKGLRRTLTKEAGEWVLLAFRK
jgi:ribosomal protein L11 methyltransferase